MLAFDAWGITWLWHTGIFQQYNIEQLSLEIFIFSVGWHSTHYVCLPYIFDDDAYEIVDVSTIFGMDVLLHLCVQIRYSSNSN